VKLTLDANRGPFGNVKYKIAVISYKKALLIAFFGPGKIPGGINSG
jgi:hypothetical protein